MSPPPLRTDADGIVRIGGIRVPLETVVSAFDRGAAAEEIVMRFPTLDLSDVYATEDPPDYAGAHGGCPGGPGPAGPPARRLRACE
jgi:hypothetical protein